MPGKLLYVVSAFSPSNVLSPHSLPQNVAFEIDDIEADWAHAAPFDFIHGRMLTGSIKNWPRLFQQCFKYVFHFHLL